MTTRHHYSLRQTPAVYHAPDFITQQVFAENNQLKEENATLKVQCHRLAQRNNDVCEKEAVLEKKTKKLDELLVKAKEREEGLMGDLETEVVQLRRQNKNLKELLNSTLRKNADLKALFESQLTHSAKNDYRKI